MIDIGLNLTNRRFDRDRKDILARAREAGVNHCIITGTSLDSSRNAVALCRQLEAEFPGMLTATVGVHPHEADSVTDDTIVALRRLVTENTDVVVAIGETGLDFNRNFSTPAGQIQGFERHIDLAVELQLPLFLHERDAHETQISILKNRGASLPRGVIHCFTGSREALENYLALGYYVGITGWICDERRGTELQELVRRIPIDRLLIETDAPFLLPRDLRPKPKSGRNEPAFLPHIAAAVARFTASGADEIAAHSTRNARALFGI